MAAGVKTIVTPQGYHLDTLKKPTYMCSTVREFIDVLNSIQKEKMEIVDSVKEWTWENYAKKHLVIWQYLSGAKSIKESYLHQGKYMDGIYSLLPFDNLVM